MKKALFKIATFLTATVMIVLTYTVSITLPISAVEDNLNKSKWNDKMVLRVEKDYLVNGYNERVRLTGVNVPTLDSVVTGDNFWENYYLAIKDWQCNLLRINLSTLWMPGQAKGSEAAWKTYTEIIDKVVSEAVNYGVYVILDDHPPKLPWMPVKADADFWKEISARYANCPNVIFGLFNEPHNVNWKQWKYGSGNEKWENPQDLGNYEKIYGMQQLVDIIRSTGAKNLISATGLESGSIWEGLTEEGLLNDSTGNGIMYEIHRYSYDDDLDTCYNAVLGKVPLYIGEFNAMNGPYKYQDAIEPWDLKDDASIDFMNRIMKFIDKWDMSFSAWSLHQNYPPMLLENESPTFTPTASGQVVKSYIAETRLYKNVTFFKDKNSDKTIGALDFGDYNSSALKRKNINLSEINSLEIKESYYRFLVTFFSQDNYSGKTFTLCGSVNDLKAAGLNFTPESIKIQRFIPENLTPKSSVSVSSGKASAKYLTDGTLKMWETTEKGRQTVIFDLNGTYYLDEIKIFHAAKAQNYYGYYNTADFRISVSYDGVMYTSVYAIENNRDSETDALFIPQASRYIKIVIDKPNRMDTSECRIVEVAAYGTKYTGKNPDRLYPILNYIPSDEFDNDNEFEPVINDTENINNNPSKQIKRYKKLLVKKTFGIPVWIWILIGSGVAVAGTVTIILIVRHSKKKKAVASQQVDIMSKEQKDI